MLRDAGQTLINDEMNCTSVLAEVLLPIGASNTTTTINNSNGNSNGSSYALHQATT